MLPTQNLPVKSIPRSVVKPRETSSIAKREASAVLTTTVKKNKRQYRDFMDFVKRVSKLKLQNYWSIIENEQDIQIYFTEPEYLISKYQIYVDISLAFSIQIYGWFLNDDHQLYKDCKRTFFNITLNELLAKLQTLQLCKGIELFEIKQADNVQKHVIQKKIRYQQYLATDNQQRKYTKEYQRSLNCEMLLTNEMDICKPCRDNSLKLKHENLRKISKSLEPAKLKAPVSFTSPERLVLTLKQQRLRNKQLEEHIEKIKLEIETSGKHINESLESDLVTLYSKADSRVVPPFMKLFWEEQQKYLVRSKTGRRYHPMIIKFCLALAAKSSSAYSELRYDPEKGSGVLVLPSLRSLRDYRNYIRPTRGCNPKVVWDLKEKTKEFSEQERYVAILLDEMKIQDDLVWDKHTGELIGFVDLGDPDLNYATLKNTNELATHVLVFLIRSIINPLAYSFATFATSGITAFQLFPIFWKAVAILEVTCNMKVIAAVADGASPNRKFFRMHLVRILFAWLVLNFYI